jgi:hypothetical protein
VIVCYCEDAELLICNWGRDAQTFYISMHMNASPQWTLRAGAMATMTTSTGDRDAVCLESCVPPWQMRAEFRPASQEPLEPWWKMTRNAVLPRRHA